MIIDGIEDLTSRIGVLVSATMDPRNLFDAVASTMLGAAHELDETAVDHELVNGSTITGKAMRVAATALVVGAMPLVLLDFVTGGPRRRGEFESWSQIDAEDRLPPEDQDPRSWVRRGSSGF